MSGEEESVLLEIVQTREYQSLRKLEKSIGKIAWREPKAAGEDVVIASADVLTASVDLGRFELQALNCRNASSAACKEIDASLRLKDELEKRTEEMTGEIQRLEALLSEERTAKTNRESYSALAKVIAGITSRSSSQKEIEVINEDIMELEAEGERLAIKKDSLGKQFMLLTQAIEDVKDVLANQKMEDGGSEEGEAEENMGDGQEQAGGPVGMEMDVEDGEEREQGER